jgi:hypothetical protein
MTASGVLENEVEYTTLLIYANAPDSGVAEERIPYEPIPGNLEQSLDSPFTKFFWAGGLFA